jgi:hypothetical protein
MGPRLMTPLFIVHAIVEISPIEDILTFLKKKNIHFKKSEIYYTTQLHIILFFKKILVMNMPVFNFHIYAPRLCILIFWFVLS